MPCGALAPKLTPPMSEPARVTTAQRLALLGIVAFGVGASVLMCGGFYSGLATLVFCHTQLPGLREYFGV